MEEKKNGASKSDPAQLGTFCGATVPAWMKGAVKDYANDNNLDFSTAVRLALGEFLQKHCADKVKDYVQQD